MSNFHEIRESITFQILLLGYIFAYLLATLVFIDNCFNDVALRYYATFNFRKTKHVRIALNHF